MGINLIRREAWGARDARGATTLTGTRGVKIHYTGSREAPAMLDDHARCAARVRAIQDDHMDRRGWNDIAYSLLVCVHGHVFEGRGAHVLPAANGPGLNSGHYAVCGLIGNKGLTRPTPEMIGGLCDAIVYLRKHGDAGRQVKGHRDGYATDCPGEYLYEWIKDGHGCPDDGDEGGGPVPKDISGYVGLKLGKPVPLPKDVWTPLFWSVETSDTDHQHANGGGPSVLNGPAQYGITAAVRLQGLPKGAEYQVRAVEIDADGKEPLAAGPIGEGLASSGDTYALYSLAADKVDEGRRVRVQVKPIGHDAVATSGTCKVAFYR